MVIMVSMSILSLLAHRLSRQLPVEKACKGLSQLLLLLQPLIFLLLAERPILGWEDYFYVGAFSCFLTILALNVRYLEQFFPYALYFSLLATLLAATNQNTWILLLVLDGILWVGMSLSVGSMTGLRPNVIRQLILLSLTFFSGLDSVELVASGSVLFESLQIVLVLTLLRQGWHLIPLVKKRNLAILVSFGMLVIHTLLISHILLLSWISKLSY